MRCQSSVVTRSARAEHGPLERWRQGRRLMRQPRARAEHAYARCPSDNRPGCRPGARHDGREWRRRWRLRHRPGPQRVLPAVPQYAQRFPCSLPWCQMGSPARLARRAAEKLCPARRVADRAQGLAPRRSRPPWPLHARSLRPRRAAVPLGSGPGDRVPAPGIVAEHDGANALVSGCDKDRAQ